MATVTLTPGAVTAQASGGGAPNTGSGVTGASPQWADGSDATYAFIQSPGGLGAFKDEALASCAAAIPGEFVSVVANARLSATGSGTVYVSVQLEDPAPGSSNFASGEFEVPGDGAIRDLSVAMESDNPTDWASVPTLRARLLAAFPSGTAATIYEVTFDVTTVDLTKPATRLFPRDDNRGLGSPRLYPPPKSGRLVGGYH